MTEYSVRWFRADDVEPFLDLYRDVLDGDFGREWFAWKYEDDPYVDHVPIAVAERGDDLVGARAFFALKMAVGDHHCIALQPCDTMVHADHRRNGLFTRMTERAIERYESSAPAFFFNFPNGNSLPGNRKLGWEVVEHLGVHYRIQNPAALVGEKDADAALTLASRASTPFVRGYNALRDRTAEAPDLNVRRERGVPATELASIYRDSPPEGLHALRDETFYGWRFENPNREYATYLANGPDGPVAMVVGRSTTDGVSSLEVTDVLPLESGERASTKAAVLERIVADNPGADLLSAPSNALPSETLRQFGFHSNRKLPLSRVTRPRMQVARGLDGWAVDGTVITQAENWAHTFAEVDSA